MKFKEGNRYGLMCTEVITHDGSQVVAVVWTHKPRYCKDSDKTIYEQDNEGMKRLKQIVEALNAA